MEIKNIVLIYKDEELKEKYKQELYKNNIKDYEIYNIPRNICLKEIKEFYDSTSLSEVNTNIIFASNIPVLIALICEAIGENIEYTTNKGSVYLFYNNKLINLYDIL